MKKEARTKKMELGVKRFISEEKLLKKGDHLLIAVSGGADSLCLLLLLHHWAYRENWKLKVAYFDHGLRKETLAEKAFVESWAKKLKLPFVGGKGETKKLKSLKKYSLEESARYLRYAFLKKEAQKFNNAKVAVAHHLNDQVETFFVTLLKGSGLGGLSGMKSFVREGEIQIVRPLLCVSKQEILEYLKFRKVAFCRDETNTDTTLMRNKVRLKLLPFLEKNFKWNILKSLPRMMKIFKEEHEVLEGMTQPWLLRHVEQTKERAHISIDPFVSLPVALQRRVIKKVLDRFSPHRNYSSSHVEKNRGLFLNPVSHKRLMLPEGVVSEKLKTGVVWFTQTPRC